MIELIEHGKMIDDAFGRSAMHRQLDGKRRTQAFA